MLHPKTDEHVNPNVEVHHLVGKLSTAESLLTEVQREVATCAGKLLFVIREILYAHPVSHTKKISPEIQHKHHETPCTGLLISP